MSKGSVGGIPSKLTRILARGGPERRRREERKGESVRELETATHMGIKKVILRILLVGVATTLLVAGVAPASYAIPLLQLYIEGSTYDTTTESWAFNTADGPIRLWVIGNTDGPGGKGDILDVRLAVAYDSSLAPMFTLTGSTTDGFAGYIDPSAPVTGTFIQTVTDGSSPVYDGRSLPSHGIYGAGTTWQEFDLGDFTLTDSQIGDFIGSVPTASGPTVGQINVYVVSFTGEGFEEGFTFHFDAYSHYVGGRFAPFSHDAYAVPEPSTVLLLGSGLAGLGLWRLRRRKGAD